MTSNFSEDSPFIVDSMPREIPGLILESYARSAGTGNQPIEGEVTSRRTSSWHERQKVLQKKKEAEEAEKEKRKEQERFAKLLASKWAEEDRKPKEKKRKRRSEEREERDRDRKGSSSRGVYEEEQPERGYAEEITNREEEKPEKIGGWSTVERPGATLMAEKELKDISRNASSSRAAAKAKPKVQGIFGLSDSDEEKPKKEALAKKKRQSFDPRDRGKKSRSRSRRRSRSRSRSRSGGRPSSTGGKPSLSAASSIDASSSLQMKLAKWKRDCKGKRVPMPKELEDEIAKMMGGGGM